MRKVVPPHFIIKNRFQKGGTYKDLLTKEILSDVCLKVMGRADYTYEFDDEGYNIGRLAVLSYRGKDVFISFSESNIQSRNSSFQSLPSALSRFILHENESKEICYYVLPNVEGNLETDYFIFMYRLMATAGVQLLNLDDFVTTSIVKFSSADDVIVHKDRLRSRQRANNSTYLTRGSDNSVQIYGKTYGANKYETTLLSVALAKLASDPVELYEVKEGNLRALPEMSKNAILSLGGVSIFTSDAAIEAREFVRDDSLRSIRFVYNLLEKFGHKKCTLCECEVPQIIQGAHIWPVAAIKKQTNLSLEKKLDHALDGHNGLWLCENHHKLFDSNTLMLSASGKVKYKRTLKVNDIGYIRGITTSKQIPAAFMHEKLKAYLVRRNKAIDEGHYLLVDA
ncbi:HNH endonuclease signature motif containing protein [Microvirga terrestris]|uniref:HNH endonuclease n=1 Tax=Microvirga terrestris TaxID=2791024 RepID=A0ABS0HUI3_9HYPH|nr:HNH endonuclease signature motif containing protein [Microvirga terrestris]MBF9197155.1 HNH endonuclease [Microvirga terrestris]